MEMGQVTGTRAIHAMGSKKFAEVIFGQQYSDFDVNHHESWRACLTERWPKARLRLFVFGLASWSILLQKLKGRRLGI